MSNNSKMVKAQIKLDKERKLSKYILDKKRRQRYLEKAIERYVKTMDTLNDRFWGDTYVQSFDENLY